MRNHVPAAPLKLAACGLAAVLLLLAGCVTAPKVQQAASADAAAAAADQATPAPPAESVAPAPPAGQALQVDELVQKWGVEVIGLRRTSGGYMLDFRFRVLDARKAAPLFVRQTKPYLLDLRTGAKFMVPNPPKTGPLRTSDPPKEGLVYWMFFANPGQYLKPGSQATVVIGDFQAQNLIVE